MQKELQFKSLDFSDIEKLAIIHRACFPKSLLGKLGLGVLDKYYAWQLSGTHPLLYAEGVHIKGKLAGFCIGGILCGAMGGFLKKHKTLICFAVLFRPWTLLHSAELKKILKGIAALWNFKKSELSGVKSKSKTFGILVIAVHPEYQKGGAGKELLLRAEKLAKEQGFKRMHLTVDADNKVAVLFYEKTGWVKRNSKNWNGEMIKEI